MRTLLPIIRALYDAGVAFVVVGGVAVVLQGHPRMTADLDLVLDLAADNVLAALEVLEGLGLQPRLPVQSREFADADVRRTWVEERNLTVFSMHDPDDPRREVDLFAENPRPFAELVASASVIHLQGAAVNVASVDDLIAMKRVAGRPQDLADIEALERLGDG